MLPVIISAIITTSARPGQAYGSRREGAMGRLRAPAAAGLAVAAVACVLVPWWRAGSAPVLLVDGPPQALAPDAWSGVELLGAPLAVALAGLAALGLALAAGAAGSTGAGAPAAIRPG